MKRIKYVGPFDAVDVGARTFKHGETVEVDDDLAASLLEQDIWSEAGKKSESAAAADHVEVKP